MSRAMLAALVAGRPRATVPAGRAFDWYPRARCRTVGSSVSDCSPAPSRRSSWWLPSLPSGRRWRSRHRPRLRSPVFHPHRPHRDRRRVRPASRQGLQQRPALRVPPCLARRRRRRLRRDRRRAAESPREPPRAARVPGRPPRPDRPLLPRPTSGPCSTSGSTRRRSSCRRSAAARSTSPCSPAIRSGWSSWRRGARRAGTSSPS